MNKASFWVGVAQLVVAILTLAVSFRQQAPVCPPPSAHHPAHHHRMHHRPPHGGLHGASERRLRKAIP